MLDVAGSAGKPRGGYLRIWFPSLREVMAQVGSKDPLTRRIYQSYIEFRSRCTPWSDMAERAFLNARSLPFPYVGRG